MSRQSSSSTIGMGRVENADRSTGTGKTAMEMQMEATSRGPVGIGANAGTGDGSQGQTSGQQQEAYTPGKTVGMQAGGTGATSGLNQMENQRAEQDAFKQTQVGQGQIKTENVGIGRQFAVDAEQKKQQAMQAEMAKNAQAQSEGLARSMGEQSKASDAAQTTQATQATQPADSTKPDYNEVYQTQADVFNETQARDWQNRMDFMTQRASERGMKGTDLNSYLAHLELGNRVGVLDARQNMLLEGLKRDMAFQEKDYFQTRSEDRADKKEKGAKYMELLNANWGDEEAVNSILQMAVSAMGEDSYFADLMNNPDSLRNLHDAGYNQLFQQRNLASSEVLRNIQDSTSLTEVNANFDNYKNAKYGSAFDVSVPKNLTVDDLDEEILSEYIQQFGEPDLTNADDVKNVYAYQQYRKDVDKSFKDEVAVGLVNELLANGGNEETAQRIRNLGTDFVFSLMDDEAMANYIGGQVDASDPVNGALGFMFSDWKGNVYGEGNPHENQPVEDKNLDSLWQSYLLASAKDGSAPLGRWEWMAAAMAVDESDEGFDFTEENLDEKTISAVTSEIIKTANSTRSQLPTDTEGNIVQLDSSIATYDSESKSWELSKEVSDMNKVEKEEALSAISTDDATFYDVLFSMNESDVARFMQNADQNKLDDMKEAGILPFDISDSELDKGVDYSEDEFSRMGFTPGNIIMKNGDWYVINEIQRRKDTETFGADDFRNFIWGNKISIGDGSASSEATNLWNDESNDEYDEFDATQNRITDRNERSGYNTLFGSK